MNYDTFFSSPRWTVLEIVSRKPSSPIEIAELMGTSVSYVSQQLKLLEAARLVVKTRTGAVEKGKPRMVFAPTNEMVHVAAVIRGMPAKRLLDLTDYHRIIMRIWLIENNDVHYYLEKLFWKVEEELDKIECIFVDFSNDKLKVVFVSESKKIKQIVDNFQKSAKSPADFSCASKFDFGKSDIDNLYPIHDPYSRILEKKLKGGNEKR